MGETTGQPTAESDVDFVALSFVRNANDVYSLRRCLEERESRAMLIAKIEKPEAWHNIDSILDASDGVMVARATWASRCRSNRSR